MFRPCSVSSRKIIPNWVERGGASDLLDLGPGGAPEDSLQEVPGLRSGQLHLSALAKSTLSRIQGQSREPGGGSDSPGRRRLQGIRACLPYTRTVFCKPLGQTQPWSDPAAGVRILAVALSFCRKVESAHYRKVVIITTTTTIIIIITTTFASVLGTVVQRGGQSRNNLPGWADG